MNTFIAFSGGVDSTSLALLVPDGIPVFTDTGWEFPELYAHIEKFERVTGRQVKRITSKHKSIPDYIRKTSFFPGHGSRYCTRMFKIEPYNDFIKKHLPAEMLIGLRADEDDRIGNLSEIDGMKIRYPLKEQGLNRVDCVKLCIEADLLPRYPLYMARGGCMGCFYKRKAEVNALKNLNPEALDELDLLEIEVNEAQKERDRKTLMFPNTGVMISEIKAQQELFHPADVYASSQQIDDVGLECGLFCNR